MRTKHLLATASLAFIPSLSDAQPLPQYDAQHACERKMHSPKNVSRCVSLEQSSYTALKLDWNKQPPEVRSKCIARITPETLIPNTTLLTCVRAAHRDVETQNRELE